MPCDHSGAAQIMEQAEEWLKARGVAREKWAGMRFRHTENTPDAKGWKSVVTEIEHRDGDWIVTGIDRRPEPAVQPGLSVA